MNKIDPQIDSNEEFAKLLEAYDSPEPRSGEVITGAVLKKETGAIYIDVGAKRSAIIPHEEVQNLGTTWFDNLMVGDEISVFVINTPHGDSDLIVSVEKMLREGDWDRAEQLLASGEMIDLLVVDQNRGGVLVEFGRVIGFVPNSHIPDMRSAAHNQQQPLKQRLVGTTIAAQVMELDREQDRLVFSATAAEEKAAEEQLKNLIVGDVVTGKVVGFKPYGAFVNFGHLTGLLHISKIAWQTISHPSDILEMGQEIDCLIDQVEMDRQRINLNLKALTPDPVTLFSENHQIEEIVEGKITDVVDFGAFIELENGAVGLLHVSEMHDLEGDHPRDHFVPGETIKVKVIDLDPVRGRIGLSQESSSK